MIISLDENPDVVAVIPTLGRNIERLNSCIESIHATTNSRGVGVIVVWNNSKSPNLNISNVHILRPGLNLGFPGALNHARKFTTSKFLWLIQDDVEVLDGCIEELISILQDEERIGVASPVSLNDGGNIPAGGRAGIFNSQGEICESLPPEEVSPLGYEFPEGLGYVASSGSLIPMQIWDEVEGFDSNFFPLLWSDADFCYRLSLLDYKSVVVTKAHIRHQVNGSTPGLLNQYLMIHNGERFRRKHFDANGTDTVASEVDVDQAILQSVARTATEVLIDFATFASQRVKENEEQAKIISIITNENALLSQSLETLTRESEYHLDAIRQQCESVSHELSLVKSSKVWRYSKTIRKLRQRVARL